MSNDEIKRSDAAAAARHLAGTKLGCLFMDYLAQEAGIWEPLSHKDERTETKAVAVRDFVMENVVTIGGSK